jgi:phosphatidylserine/phosphatidylglycerophosphate/cardiolipin synthase-like enzyme
MTNTTHQRETTYGTSQPLGRFLVTAAILITTLVGVVLTGPASGAESSAKQLTTFVEPSAGYGFLDRAVASAKHTIDLSMYELEDRAFEADLVARARAGVVVRVVLDTEYGIRSDNAPAAAELINGGVRVTWAPSSQIFHAKYLIIDGSTLFVGTGNLTAQWYSSTRDFWVRDTNHADVAAAGATFAADWTHQNAALSAGSGDLVWSPGSAGALVTLIGSAKRSLLVENEEMDNYGIESALESAARHGVDVKVVMTYDSSWHAALAELASAGVHVHVLASNQVYIHAKVICADCSTTSGTVFVGSENFSISSLDYNRELGIITKAASVVGPIRATVASDYALGSTRF